MRLPTLATTTLLAAALCAPLPAGLPKVLRTIPLGGDGGWDYLAMDGQARRVYISRSTRVMVVDADSGRLHVTLSTENDYGHLPWGDFVERLYLLKVERAWNPDLILSALLQYDTASRDLGANLRLRWSPKPGVDAFLVWNRGWQRPDLNGPLRFLPREETLSAKLRWTFRP